MSEAEKIVRKRRTRAEMKLWLQEELKRVEAEEKAEVVKLLSDAHDTLDKVSNMPAAAALKTMVSAQIIALKSLLAAASK